LVIAEAIPHEKSDIGGIITVSQGVVSVLPDTELMPADLVKRADHALYQSKHKGRNTVTVG
jgi:PleD family two-component response regulator